ncbi:integrase, catalytic region, zinc finger, CCHC-type containing protein [Tanacetum coccineum]|uniref:Integrase, catalytic region, zinc finger, CCHC-type containing protein n=1 Tax=Tanacetum coccineum TaxID=301880 RepID=A0ABQ4WDP2_9ASTR
MHNNIMVAGSRDHLPILATGRYAQWHSRFLRYIDSRPNGNALRKCLLEGPYQPTTVIIPAEAIHLLLTEIEDEIYSTVDACKIAHEMWIAIERLQQAKNANPLALVATTQPHQDPYYQTSNSHKSYAPTSKASLPTRSHVSTRNKGKKIAKPITPLSESASEEDSDPEQAQKDKEITSSDTRNKNVDTTSRYKNDNQTGQFKNQRTMTVAGARETVGSLVVKQSGIQCFNYKKFGHFAKECRKLKRVKDSTYHKEKMLLCKQAEKDFPLQAEKYDWLADTDEEIDEQELEAHYSYMEKIQEVHTVNLGTDSELFNTCVVETDDSNVIPDSPDMCDNDIQNDQNDIVCDDEPVALANLIANLKLDVFDNIKIQKQLKK